MKFPSVDGYQRRGEQLEKLERWHSWFAWYPVRITTWQKAWLETVERKGTWWGIELGWCYEYRPLEINRKSVNSPAQ